VTSAIAAPAAAGIPVTHRGLASAFVVVSGHDEDTFGAAIAHIAPNTLTVVVLMGLARSSSIASALIDAGWERATPAAVVVDAWRADQQTWLGSLEHLAAETTHLTGNGPGTIVIGDVVALGIHATFDVASSFRAFSDSA
jgi:uroporphyrin-III C-methyltransferase/precorrin-2 dehydrogenase/sirohydrochlorin ferrochelatase